MGAVGDFLSSPYTGMGMSAMGTGMSTAAAYRDAQAQNMANQLNAMTYQQNAELNRIQAATARQFGEQEYKDVRREYARLQGEQRAGYGASGVDVNAGSAAAVQANTAAEGVYAAQKTKYQRDLEAWQLEQTARQYDFEALKAKTNKVNPWVPAATAAIGGLTSMYSTFGNWQRNPVTVGDK